MSDTSSTIVTGLQGNPISNAAPTDGYALLWDAVGGYWKPAILPIKTNISGLITSNYTITSANYILCIGTLSSNITINLPTTPSLNDTYIVKDVNGTAGNTYLVTISGNGNNIDGETIFIIGQNYASFTFIWTGIQWSIF